MPMTRFLGFSKVYERNSRPTRLVTEPGRQKGFRNRFPAFDINSALFSEILAVVRQSRTSWRRNAKTHFDQSNRDIRTVKFRPSSRTWRANVDVSSLETVRSPAVLPMSKPGVAPLSRANPRLNECRPFRTLASLRDQTQRSLVLHARDQKEEEQKSSSSCC
jgi:hypothetical protein